METPGGGEHGERPATAADLQAVRLSMQAALAQNYCLLRIADVQQKLLDDTVSAKALELTRNRYAAGVAAKADVHQAQTQLKLTDAQATSDAHN